MLTNACWLALLLVVVLVILAWVWRRRWHPQSQTAVTATVQRLLKPRTPEACPACRQQAAAPLRHAPTRPPVAPWRERKSRRGAMGRIATQPFACPNRQCDYYRITDALLLALVGDGAHTLCERIQTLRCQACATTFSTRRNTPLYRLKTSSQRSGEVLTAVALGSLWPPRCASLATAMPPSPLGSHAWANTVRRCTTVSEEPPVAARATG